LKKKPFYQLKALLTVSIWLAYKNYSLKINEGD
jgi:hypothetical protein